MTALVNETNLRRTTLLESHVVDDTLVLVRETMTVTVVSSTGDLKVNTDQISKPGYDVAKSISVPQMVIEHAMTPKEFAKRVAGKDYEVLDLKWFSPEYIEKLRTMHRVEIDREDRDDIEKCRHDVYTAVVVEGGSPETLTRIDRGSELYFDRHDKILPRAVFFDYIVGIRGEDYNDLVAVNRVLLANPEVRVVLKDGYRALKEVTDEKEIGQVPYYNGGGSCVEFIWVPSRESYTKAYEHALKRKRGYDVKSSAFALDLFGLRELAVSDKEKACREKIASKAREESLYD